MSGHLLDRPAWSALTTRHAQLAEGGELARRYRPDTVPFAAARDDAPDSLRELAALAAPGQSMLLLQAGSIVLPPGLVATVSAEGVQMIAERRLPRVQDDRVEQLGEADAAEMLDLATLTKPGPFTLRAMALGSFWGLKREGRLIAMAGERMKHEGLTELSGVCVHPDFRGEGLGRLLSLFVAGEIFARGEQAYLHAYATNVRAIALYESMGFRLRARMNVAMIQAA